MPANHELNITLLSSPKTALLRKLSEHPRNAHKPWTNITLPSSYFFIKNSSVEEVVWPLSQCRQSMNSPHMLQTRKLCWLIVMVLCKETMYTDIDDLKKVHFFKSSLSVYIVRNEFEGGVNQFKSASVVLPCKLNPCPCVCYQSMWAMKKPYLFRAYRGLCYTVKWGLSWSIINHYA